VAAPIAEPVIGEAGRSMAAAEWARAEGLLRGRLKFRPHDVQVLAMLGETLRRRSRFAEAETFLRRCLERHPSYDSVAHGLALCLRALGREAEALVLIGPLAARDPGNIGLQDLRASCLAAVGDPAAALAIFEAMPREAEGNTGLWVSRGLALKSVGRSVEATGAFRRAIALAPAHGEAWWRLAELRAGTFTAADEAALRKALATAGLDILSRVHLHYALARAREDQGDAAEAFALYEAGARLNRSRLPYDAAETTARRRGQEALFTKAFFHARVGGGAPDPAPIFIVGLPRCGSTLVEQILASHSAVEGTSELSYLPMIARAIAGGAAGTDPALPVAALSTADRGAFGEAYLARAAAHRRIGRPRFIDKNLGNFQNIGLIELMLPRATIIDVRRHPLASGVALFRHLLGPGWTFACGLEDIGGFYRDYVALMAHFDAVLPGRVHRVIYEDLVEDIEATMRRLLDHCGLPFEDACLRFHDTERAVLTPSAAQVRRPMFREGLDGWRRFEPWLAPLKAALGPALTQWR
jgi:tetratricopeptide (TPR) repeat protein